MLIFLGFNLLIIAIIAFFASHQFGVLAVSKGYPPERAKKYPFFIGAGAMFFIILGQTLLSFVSPSMIVLLLYCWSGLIMLMLAAILRRSYKNMLTAPDAGAETKKAQKK